MNNKSVSQSMIRPIQFILNDKFRWPLHILFWLVMYMDECLSLIGITYPLDSPLLFFVELAFDALVVYLNLYVFIPKLLLKNKIGAYAILTFISVGCISIITNFLYPIEDPVFIDISTSFASTFTTTLTLMGTAVGIKLFKYYLKNQRKISDLENASLEAELENLKNQVNPHFLFNALNGIYVNARKKKESVPESILQLSDLMRYQLYDCTEEQVALTKEIDYIHNFIEMDKLRKSNTDIQFDVIGEASGKLVSPFLFMPFVENALKHGANLENESFVRIELYIKESQLEFKVENSKPEKALQQLDGGIGLPNVKRRLALLYPNRHKLSINDRTNIFTVNLNLQLD